MIDPKVFKEIVQVCKDYGVAQVTTPELSFCMVPFVPMQPYDVDRDPVLHMQGNEEESKADRINAIRSDNNLWNKPKDFDPLPERL